MKQPTISIIITILNGEKTVRHCLDSIKKQLFTHYEVVIVDGGSTDRTLTIVNDSLIVNKIVQVLPGIGLYAGLNVGITLATGQWLYFMGCDDELHDTHTLQKVANDLMEKSNTFDVLVGNVNYVKQKFVFRPQLGSPYWLHYKVHHQGMFYRNTLFDSLHYDEGLSISSDYELNLKLALAKTVHKHIDIIICDIGEDGISNKQIKRSSAEIHKIHSRLFKGITRQWVVNYFKLQRTILMTRRRLNLVNLKYRISKKFKL